MGIFCLWRKLKPFFVYVQQIFLNGCIHSCLIFSRHVRRALRFRFNRDRA